MGGGNQLKTRYIREEQVATVIAKERNVTQSVSSETQHLRIVRCVSSWHCMCMHSVDTHTRDSESGKLLWHYVRPWFVTEQDQNYILERTHEMNKVKFAAKIADRGGYAVFPSWHKTIFIERWRIVKITKFCIVIFILLHNFAKFHQCMLLPQQPYNFLETGPHFSDFHRSSALGKTRPSWMLKQLQAKAEDLFNFWRWKKTTYSSITES